MTLIEFRTILVLMYKINLLIYQGIVGPIIIQVVAFCNSFLNKYRRVTRGGEGEGLPCSFFENWKKFPQFLGKMPWLLSSMGEKQEIFACGTFPFRSVDDYLSKCHNSNKTSPALENSRLSAWVKRVLNLLGY